MENLTKLAGSQLVDKLQDIISNKSIVIIEYKNVFREVYPLELKLDKLWIYQKSDYSANKKEGVRQMFIKDLILWDIVKENIELSEWKLELKEVEIENARFAAMLSN